MADPLILVTSTDDDPQLKMLAGLPHTIARTAEEAAAITSAEVILHWEGTRALAEAAFRANPQARWMHSRFAGLDRLLFPELVASPIPLTNGQGIFSEPLGEFALAMMLYFAKDFPRMLRNKAAQRWEVFDVDELSAQTVGIVGYGDIGRAVATRARAMGMRVLAVKRHAAAGSDPMVARFYPREDLHAMLGSCDYLVFSLPLTPETRHMISTAEFAAMKPTAVVINVGRGPVVDQAALVRALEAKQIKGAGLDVFEQEPIPAGDPIWSFENVFISPHTADHDHGWIDRSMKFFLKQYESFRRGGPLENIVDKQLGY
jgi:phosphoglycerate dehydrogenase-like enzyme